MADLDVTDVLDDPDFKSSFRVIRKKSMIQDGYTVEVGMDPVDAEGMVAPASGSKLYRKPDGEMTVADINIITKYPLSSGDATFAPDVVVLKNGTSYMVINSNPYEFGKGFVQATCLQVRFNPA